MEENEIKEETHETSFTQTSNNSKNDESLNDEFLAKLSDTSTNVTEEDVIKESNSKMTPSEETSKKEVNKEKSFEDSMENLQSKPINDENVSNASSSDNKEKEMIKDEDPSSRIRDINEINKTTVTEKKPKKVVEVVTSKEIELRKDEKNKPKIESKVDISDDLEKRMNQENSEFIDGNTIEAYKEQEEILNEPVDSFIHKHYEDADTDVENKKIEIVTLKNEENASKNEEKDEKNGENEVSREEKMRNSHIYGGDGIVTAFKTRRSKVSKILSSININDTSSIDPIDIDKRNDIDKSKMYVQTILPTLKPCYSVVPLIISGTVITMTAFSWPDIREICLIEEKNDDLDPEDNEYTYKKNMIFIEKRKKQLELFYSHIFSVSGYPEKPSYEEFYGKIVKWPDFPQLFFAAYSATFHKSYDFNVMCPRCGLEQIRSINPKNLCFMLNKNINIDRLNYYLQKGASVSSSDESLSVFKEFQNEKLVEKSNSTYRTIKPFSDSAIVCSLKVPTILEAIDSMESMVEHFRDKPLEVIVEDGTTISIDSSFGVNDIKELKNLKKYLYINSILVAEPSELEDKIEIGYVEVKTKDDIFNAIANLSIVDYKELLTDPNLNAISNISGIRHQFDSKICDNENCKQDMGLMAVEPETLFFTIAEQELPN